MDSRIFVGSVSDEYGVPSSFWMDSRIFVGLLLLPSSAAEEAGAPEEELAPLREALAACEKDFEDNRQQSMALVRQKLRQQEERNSQLQKQKGQ